jgi:hypothetical protein
MIMTWLFPIPIADKKVFRPAPAERPAALKLPQHRSTGKLGPPPTGPAMHRGRQPLHDARPGMASVKHESRLETQHPVRVRSRGQDLDNRRGQPMARHGTLARAFILAFLLAGGRDAAAQTTPPETLAAQLRLQGYRCDDPVTAQQDTQLSKPDEKVWNLKCINGSYRMRLRPDLAAGVEKLD